MGKRLLLILIALTASAVVIWCFMSNTEMVSAEATASLVTVDSMDGTHTSPSGISTDSLAHSHATEVGHGDTLRIMMAGDIMMGTLYPSEYLPANGGRNLFDEVAPMFSRADLVIGNLEGTFARDTSTVRRYKDPKKAYIFQMPPEYVELLKSAHFSAMSIINNHAFDFGKEGFADTRSTLRAADMKYFGAQADGEVLYITKNGVKYGLCAFATSPGGILLYDFANIKRVVAEARAESDIVIVSFHGGAEGSKARHVPKCEEFFMDIDRGDVYKFAHTCVDAGADIVFGHGPHVARALEMYQGKLIAYSLGNFCTPYRFNLLGVSGYAPLLEVCISPNREFLGGKIHSFRQWRGSGPRRDATHAVAKEIATLSAQDFPTTRPHISSTGVITKR